MKTRLAVLVVVLTAALACATRVVPSSGKPDTWDPQQKFSDRIGFAVCEDDKGVGFMNVAYIGLPHWMGHVLHERKHIEQIARFPNCRAWENYLQENAADVEAEAFCVDLLYDVAQGKPFHVALEEYAKWLSLYYPELQISFPQAVGLIMKYCETK